MPRVKHQLQFTKQSAAAWRLRAQGLLTPFPALEVTTTELIGVQAQMLPPAALALAVRTAQLTASDVWAALYRERSLVRLWGQRHTLHLYASRDWPLICAANADRPTYFEREALARGEALDAYHALLDRVEQLLLQRGTLGRSDLRSAELGLSAAHLNGWGGIFSDLARRGAACHAEPTREARMAHRLHWLPQLDWQPPSAHEANLQLVRRYLHAYGPATAADLALWRGRTVAEVRGWLTALRDELVAVTVDGRSAWLLAADADGAAAPDAADLPVLLLARFELLLIAYADKSSFLAAEHQQRVRRPAGHIEATIWQQGQVIGTWQTRELPAGLQLVLRPFAAVDRGLQRQLTDAAVRIAALMQRPLAELTLQSPSDG